MTKLTETVLSLIAQERLRQDLQHGPQRDLPLTRPGMRYMDPEGVLRATYELRKRDGTLSHADIILEESAEAFDAATIDDQIREAVEAASCWCKAIEALLYQTRDDD